MDLLQNQIFLLLAIILLGDALGRVKVKNFSLGQSAIVFVALAFGHFGFVLTDTFQTLGLVLFIYSIGLQAGPGFMSSFKQHGLKQTLGAVAMELAAFATALGIALGLGLDAATAAGAFAGALTSTPGLAVAVELTGKVKAPAVYGLTYAFGVLSVIVFIKLLPKLLRIDVDAEENRLRAELAAEHPPLEQRHIEITNPNLFGKRLADLHLREVAPVTLTRVLHRHSEEPELICGDTVFQEGDQLRLVGRGADLDKVELFIGKRIPDPVRIERAFIVRDIIVSKRDAAGLPISAFNPRAAFNVQVARLIRSGIEVPVTAETRVHVGDVLRVVGDAPGLANLAKILGNNVEASYTASVFVIFLGLFAGFLLGQVPLSLPWVGAFKLGTTGGVLLAGLVASAVYRTGPVVWAVPATTTQFLRELGLVLFLATVGTSAGAGFVDTLEQHGLALLGAGMAISLCALIVGLLVCRRLLRIQFLRMLGVIAGGMTSTPGLAAATSVSNTAHASAAYATVYPVALIAKILLVKLLVMALGVT